MSERVVGPGFALQLGSTAVIASATYTTIGGIQDGPNIDGLDAEEVDTTGQDDGGYETNVQGLKLYGTSSFVLFLDPQDTQHLALQALWQSGEKRAFKIIDTDSDESETTFIAWVKSVSQGRPVRGALTCNLTLRITDDFNFGVIPA